MCECSFISMANNLNFSVISDSWQQKQPKNKTKKTKLNTEWQHQPLKTWFSIQLCCYLNFNSSYKHIDLVLARIELSVKPEKSDRNDNSNSNCYSNSSSNSLKKQKKNINKVHKFKIIIKASIDVAQKKSIKIATTTTTINR